MADTERRRELFGAVCDLPPNELRRWLAGYVEGTDLPGFHKPTTRNGRLATEARRWLAELEGVARAIAADADTASVEELEAAAEVFDRARWDRVTPKRPDSAPDGPDRPTGPDTRRTPANARSGDSVAP